MGQSCVAAVLFIHEATVALKVIQLEDIIPRYLATCVSPVHVAGRTTAVHYTPSLCVVCCVTQHVAGGIYLSQMLGWKTAARFTLSYSGLCSNSAEHLLERVSMAKASLHQQEMQFHPRAARLSSSSLHKGALSLCISLSRKCSSPSALSCPCSVADCAFCYRSLPLLWSYS